MRAVVIQHEEHEGPGMIAPALEAAGFQLTRRFRQVKHEDVGADLWVVLGGPMGVYEADAHPFLGSELAFLAERLAVDAPVWGVCLGAQLLAAAAGAEVFPGRNGFEVGAGPLRWTKEGLADPVIGGVPPKSVVAHWHGDTFKPVPGASLLASTDRYAQQAFRIGRSYGFQFHLELTAEELGAWFTRSEADLVARGKDLSELRAGLGRLRGAEASNRALLDRLAHHFASSAT
jgi:GMP synthase (glutamine-hydrolysing)